MTNRYACPICGEYKPKTALTCTECREVYGAPAQWPEWVKFMVSDNERTYKAGSRSKTREAPLSAAFMPEGEPLYFGDPKDYVTVRYPKFGDGVSVSIPLSPYDNEEDNIRYRKANGIG